MAALLVEHFDTNGSSDSCMPVGFCQFFDIVYMKIRLFNLHLAT